MENKMLSMPVRRLLLHMSWPMMLSMFIQALYNLVDSMFVAQLSADGFVALSLAYPVQALMVSVCVGAGVGVNTMLSRRLGEGRPKDACAVALNGYFLYVCCWLLFLTLGALFSRPFLRLYSDVPQIVAYGSQYLTIITVGSVGMCMQFAGERVLQASGDAVGPMIIQGIGAVINLILDPILIFGLGPFPRLEVAGAAIATILGQIVGMLVGLALVRRSRALPLQLKGFRPSGAAVGEILHIGLPAMVMQSLTTVMSLGMNKLLALFSETGVFLLGAYSKLQTFIFMPVYGLNNGLIPVVSFNYGARRRDRVVGLVRFALVIALSILGVGMLLLLFFPAPLLALFDAGPEILADGIPALRMIALSFLFAAVSIIFCSSFQALGAPMLSLAISLLRQAAILLPVALILCLVNPRLVWLCFLAAESVSCLLSLILWRWVSRSKLDQLEV